MATPVRSSSTASPHAAFCAAERSPAENFLFVGVLVSARARLVVYVLVVELDLVMQTQTEDRMREVGAMTPPTGERILGDGALSRQARMPMLGMETAG